MAKDMYKTPNLDALESGPWPSFVTGLKRLAKDKDYVVDLLGQLFARESIVGGGDDLARALTFVLVGIPIFLALAAWTRSVKRMANWLRMELARKRLWYKQVAALCTARRC